MSYVQMLDNMCDTRFICINKYLIMCCVIINKYNIGLLKNMVTLSKWIIHFRMLVLIQRRCLIFYRFTPLSTIASLSRVLTGLLRTFYCSLQIISGEQPAIDACGLLKRTCDY